MEYFWQRTESHPAECYLKNILSEYKATLRMLAFALKQNRRQCCFLLSEHVRSILLLALPNQSYGAKVGLTGGPLPHSLILGQLLNEQYFLENLL